MSSEPVMCGPCSFTNSIKDAISWCTNCEEGFCSGCEKVHTSTKMSRDHVLISTDDYQTISDIYVSKTCENHEKNLELYCKTHDEAICTICITKSHKSCKEVVELEEVTKDVQYSAALVHLEEMIDRTIENLVYNISDRDSILNDLNMQEDLAKKRLQEIRESINKRLDELENKLTHSIADEMETCKSKAKHELLFFESMKQQLSDLKNKITKLKQFASSLKVFLGTRQITKEVTDHIRSMKQKINTSKNYTLELKFNPCMVDMLDINEFGYLDIVESVANLQLREDNTEQAQMLLTETKTVFNNNVKLKMKFKIKQETSRMCISGCVVLPNGHILIADYDGQKQLMEYNDNGEHIRDIPVSCRPYDLKVIDTDRIAVSYGAAKYIEVMIVTNDIRGEIAMNNRCWGISFEDGKLYVVVEDKGIVILEITGRVLSTIECDVSAVRYLTISKDRICFTNWDRQIVHCYSVDGDKICPFWHFKDPNVCFPMGIAMDKNQNVYVVGQRSGNMTMIQDDGSASKTLLTNSDGLYFPSVICYEKDRNLLLVCDRDSGNAALYSIV